MIGLIRKSDGTLAAIVESTDGYDLAEFDVADVPDGIEPARLRWNGTALVERDPTPDEETNAELRVDALWSALKAARPAQVEAWLEENVTNLASARRVLKLLLLIVQRLGR